MLEMMLNPLWYCYFFAYNSFLRERPSATLQKKQYRGVHSFLCRTFFGHRSGLKEKKNKDDKQTIKIIFFYNIKCDYTKICHKCKHTNSLKV